MFLKVFCGDICLAVEIISPPFGNISTKTQIELKIKAISLEVFHQSVGTISTARKYLHQKPADPRSN
jgi:hypothetical protein